MQAGDEPTAFPTPRSPLVPPRPRGDQGDQGAVADPRGALCAPIAPGSALLQNTVRTTERRPPPSPDCRSPDLEVIGYDHGAVADPRGAPGAPSRRGRRSYKNGTSSRP